MASYAQKIALQSDSFVYQLRLDGEADIDYFTCLLAVMPHKQRLFEAALQRKDAFRAEDYGRVLYYGAGILSFEQAQQIIATTH
jgi:hypothetical protein